MCNPTEDSDLHVHTYFGWNLSGLSLIAIVPRVISVDNKDANQTYQADVSLS